MQASERDALKQRHRYNEWAGKSASPSDRSVREFTFTGDELPGLRLERVDRRAARASLPEPTPVTDDFPRIRSSVLGGQHWRRTGQRRRGN